MTTQPHDETPARDSSPSPFLSCRLRESPARLVTTPTGEPLGVITRRGPEPVFQPWPGAVGLAAADLRGILSLLDDARDESSRNLRSAEAPSAGPSLVAAPETAEDATSGDHAASEEPVEDDPEPAPAPVPPTITPLTVAAHIRPDTLTVDAPHGCTRDETVDGVTILGRVVEIADAHGYDLAMLADAAKDPERTWPGTSGTRCHLRGPIMVVVADDTSEVIAIASREDALRRSAFVIATGQPRAKSGGCGKPVPRDINALLDRLDAHGFVVDRTRPHYSITHPAVPGVRATAPKSPSDSRSIPNTISQIRRSFDIDIRDEPQK